MQGLMERGPECQDLLRSGALTHGLFWLLSRIRGAFDFLPLRECSTEVPCPGFDAGRSPDILMRHYEVCGGCPGIVLGSLL